METPSEAPRAGLVARLYDRIVDPRTGSGWRLPALDGLRGVAASMVIVGHTLHTVDGMGASPLWLGPLERGGSGGVVLFFALSGFLLYLPWLRASLGEGREPRLKDYALRRCLRIMPAYYASVVLVAVARVALGGKEPLGLAAMALHFLFLPTLIAPMQTVYWTLQVEEFFYWLLPLLHRLRLRFSTPRLVGLACLVAACWATTGFSLFEDERWRRIWLQQTPFFLPAFVLGIYTAVRWTARPQPGNGRTLVMLGTAGYLAFAPLAQHLAYRNVLYTHATELAMAGVASMVVLGVARGGAPWLAHPVLRFLGAISFSLYLWHMVVIRVVPVPQPIEQLFLPRLTYTFAISVAVALISYLVVERPFLALRPQPGSAKVTR